MHFQTYKSFDANEFGHVVNDVQSFSFDNCLIIAPLASVQIRFTIPSNARIYMSWEIKVTRIFLRQSLQGNDLVIVS